MDSNKKYWKGLEELQQTPAFVESSKGEFAESIPVEDVLNEAGLSTKTPRRDFLKALGFGLGAVTLAACNRTPVHKAVPYIIKPEEVTPGIPNYYASSFNGQSVLVRTREGRPISLAANPNSIGLNQGTDSTTAASVLDLYDMSKLQNPQVGGKDVEWSKLDSTVIAALDKAAAAGKQIAVVASTVNSPSMLAAIVKFTTKYPTASLVQVDAVSYSGIIEANKASFGKAVVPSYHFKNANVVVSVAADFLGSWLEGEEHTQDYIKNRDYKSLKNGQMSRHIQFESGLSMTGSNADVRIAIKPSEEGAVLISLYNAITGQSLAGGVSNKKAQTAIALASKELVNAKGNAVVVAGSNDVNVQLLANAINTALGAYGAIIDLDNFAKKYQGSDAAFQQFLANATAGQVGVALFLNSNPVYDYFKPADVKSALSKVEFTLSFSDRADETASELKAIAPTCTFLEAWGDASAKEGYYTIVQPTINPVFNTRQAEQSFLVWAGDNTNIYDFVKQNWEANILAGTGKSWKELLQTGFVYKGSETGSSYTANVDVNAVAAAIASAAKAVAGEVELKLYESTVMRDGRYANNAYLQELPDPVSKVTWDNYAAINPKFAEQLGLGENSTVKVEANGYAVELPVVLQPGQALGTVSIAVGYGRTKVGKAGNDVGKNAFPFARLANGTVQFEAKATVTKASATYELAQTQTHHTIEGRNIIRETTFAKYLKDPNSESGRFSDTHKTYDLWNKFESPGHKWVMAIDLNACTGCGSCIVACNVENNIPVVGRDEVRRRREMHWLRIDRYYTLEAGDAKLTKEKEIAKATDLDYESVTVVHQPMLCQHCDHAPCETVCPVLATVHSSEGLNHMAYNRCFGTRYCANNCPYKVRRFNWFNYWNDSRFDNYLNNEFTQLVLNPDVTTRSRGVMEKCSMCIQRIQAGKLHAKMENRKLKDGDVKMACQEACSANAIIFGDVNDPESEVSKALRNERVYYVLEEINVQPNIGYMTKVRNTFEA
ncbi:TAT-variant-translocated molybdopterin oxidoreductase [Sphingobacterium psychroaquaticum]|uniref:Prokaryotic molybdopterin-containing oxidoreductase family, iron-sulfur binding subunit n=1 Tax=Sphingobacterium psychroaquaticum TaxID=561061 RepID=A0A1X7K1M0_9SPHI|nr:TAT-variant-translocated molybdopterin oxidoreductase [Sphingobacterium psychroaquaticum]SMG34413.1 prokaryotic molybdopterin-containing oxidoreductase family, iron-sulfur binding subunit [Sphingobacterium psychroaquaticum]